MCSRILSAEQSCFLAYSSAYRSGRPATVAKQIYCYTTLSYWLWYLLRRPQPHFSICGVQQSFNIQISNSCIVLRSVFRLFASRSAPGRIRVRIAVNTCFCWSLPWCIRIIQLPSHVTIDYSTERFGRAGDSCLRLFPMVPTEWSFSRLLTPSAHTVVCTTYYVSVVKQNMY